MKHIISILRGGLGNQLFQYSMARSQSIDNNSKLYLDKVYYTKVTHCHYSLHHFNIFESVPDSNLLNEIEFRTVKERTMGYDPKIIESLPQNPAFYGYWQNAQYFEKNKDIILEELTLKTDIREDFVPLIRRLNEENTCSIHVRGGDYIGWDKFNVVTPKYYEEAFNMIESENPDISYLLFTDDLPYAQKLLPKTNKRITHVQGLDYEELYLMSLCKHNIIANSSFSWWGSYMNKNTNKTIIAPSRWFNNDGRTSEHLEINPWTPTMRRLDV